MEKTFALRRHEVIQDKPLVAEIKSRWPALFCEHEVSAEFTRITTIPLVPKFMSQLDRYSEKMRRVFHKKGGAAGRKIADFLSVVDQNDSTANRRSGILQGLTVYLNEDPAKLVYEYESENPEETRADLEQILMGIYVIKHPGADADQSPEDIGIIIEGVTVLEELKDVASAYALLFGLMYDLNLSYPPDLKYTFEFIQKVLMELEPRQLSTKVQVLKNKLLD
ncbi:hypothetical protein OJAV_G00118470 [Oryzias javanicus]|uniref:Uncharacterized protein n=1 Tax=Oryzias javanicus TaxID=123683 RepID=A0A3S2PFR2_ORYJA|nr:hypothetical protein OJAV_G00118470 [Oryzias javanicus]